MIKWIICDLDGTIIKHNRETHELTISPDTVDKINNIIQSKKYKFTIATGRHYLNAKQTLEKFGINLGDDVFIIGMNGAQIYDSKQDKLIYKKFLSKGSMDRIEHLRDYLEDNYRDKYILFGYSDNNKFVYLKNKNGNQFENMKEQMDSYESFDPQHFKTLVANNFEEFPNIFKIIVAFHTEYDYKHIVSEFNKIEKDMDYVKSDVMFVEGMPKNVTKLTAIEYIKNNYYYDINKTEILAFGDSYNDLEMLKYVGTSVTRNTADDDIKKVCTYVIDADASDFVSDGIDLLVDL